MASVSVSQVGEIAKEAVKEAVLGHDESSENHSSFSDQTHRLFEKYAHLDEETGEMVMSQNEFIDAITEGGEDFVSQFQCLMRQAAVWESLLDG